jgi:hypothetical protein
MVSGFRFPVSGFWKKTIFFSGADLHARLWIFLATKNASPFACRKMHTFRATSVSEWSMAPPLAGGDDWVEKSKAFFMIRGLIL